MVNVTKRFESTTVLQAFSLSLEKGQVVSLLAPSGHGKTTILHLIAGILQPDHGMVKVHASKIGYIFQEHRLIPWKTALQNVLFVMSDLTKKERKTKALKLLQQVGLEHVSNLLPSQLSGGMKQRVNIARAFAYEPDLILMDEPFSALDIERKENLQDNLVQLIETYQQTIIYVTHDPLEAAKISDKVFILKNNHHQKQLPIEHYVELTIDKPRADRDEAYNLSTAKSILSLLKGDIK